jgi:hypothetical protein
MEDSLMPRKHCDNSLRPIPSSGHREIRVPLPPWIFEALTLATKRLNAIKVSLLDNTNAGIGRDSLVSLGEYIQDAALLSAQEDSDLENIAQRGKRDDVWKREENLPILFVPMNAHAYKVLFRHIKAKSRDELEGFFQCALREFDLSPPREEGDTDDLVASQIDSHPFKFVRPMLQGFSRVIDVSGGADLATLVPVLEGVEHHVFNAQAPVNLFRCEDSRETRRELGELIRQAPYPSVSWDNPWGFGVPSPPARWAHTFWTARWGGMDTLDLGARFDWMLWLLGKTKLHLDPPDIASLAEEGTVFWVNEFLLSKSSFYSYMEAIKRAKASCLLYCRPLRVPTVGRKGKGNAWRACPRDDRSPYRHLLFFYDPKVDHVGSAVSPALPSSPSIIAAQES